MPRPRTPYCGGMAAISDGDTQGAALGVVDGSQVDRAAVPGVEVRKLGGVREGFVDGQHQVAELLIAERDVPLQPVAELDSGLRRCAGIGCSRAHKPRPIVYGRQGI
jgi:hypothetical protein